MWRWLLAASAALAFFGALTPADGRPLTVDDLLHGESFGAVAIDPGGRWLVFERRDPYDSGRRYDYDHANSLALSRLQVVDLTRPGPARPLLRDDPGPGLVMGPFSPSGGALAVYRLQGRRWTLGVVMLATGAVRWFDVTPDGGHMGRSVQWRSENELLVIARGDRLPPLGVRRGWILADRLPKLWAAAASGAGAHTVLGSGVYAAVRERPPATRLLRLDVDTGAATVVTTGAYFDLELSPDRRRVALFSSGPDLQVGKADPVRGAAGIETEATRLTLVDLRTGVSTSPCPDLDLLPQLLSWSPSGRALLVLARGGDGLWTSGHLLRLDAATGMGRTVGADLAPHADLNPVVVWTGWMGEDPLAFGRARTDRSGREDWYRLGAKGAVDLTAALPAADRQLRLADSHRLTVLAGRGVWTVDSARGRSTELADQAVRLPVQPEAQDAERLADAASTDAWLALGQGPTRILAWLDASGVRRVLPLPPGEGSLAAASWPARSAVWRERDRRGVEQLVLVRADAPPLALATVNADLASVDAPDPRPVRHKGPDGQDLVSWLYRPAAPSNGPPPLLVRPYLGANYPSPPQDPPAEAGFLLNIGVLTGHGYAVLVPSLPNPRGGMVDPAAHLADRILAIVDAAAADPALDGAFDAHRVAVAGFSFGGYTAMTAITQTHRFRAAVAISGISDLTAYWASLSPFAYVTPEDGYVSNWRTGGVEATQPTLLGPPWAQAARYARNSPLLSADRIETPLLLIHGAMDPIPQAGSEAMYSALFRQDKDALLVTYWGALHGVTSPGDLRDLYARTFAFLDANFASLVRVGDAAPAANPERASASGGPRLPPLPRPPDRSPHR